MKLQNVVHSQQFDIKTLDELFAMAREMEIIAKNGSNLLTGKIMGTLFYEPSTRTRMSFESAMLKLGGNVISTENAKEFSSATKGETVEDTIRVMEGYVDVIVMRHYREGSAERAAQTTHIPFINAGDGTGQHPTQALLDLYTIQKELGKINGISIAMVGDLAHGRTVRSLAYLLAKYKGIKIYFVAPKSVKMNQDIKLYLKKHKIEFIEEDSLKIVAPKVDVIYQTRIQRERFVEKENLEEYEEAHGKYIIDNSILDIMKSNSIIMHPLPRAGEIRKEVDTDPRAAYFRQAQNGLYLRMALLK
ncbi:MAG: aspartate carbamoyltransferase, partial [bacterium]|nr:aspartate carbamoyltransferase [bacterium]